MWLCGTRSFDRSSNACTCLLGVQKDILILCDSTLFDTIQPHSLSLQASPCYNSIVGATNHIDLQAAPSIVPTFTNFYDQTILYNNASSSVFSCSPCTLQPIIRLRRLTLPQQYRNHYVLLTTLRHPHPRH